MRRLLPKFTLTIDFWLLIPTLVLSVVGILFIYSSGINSLGINTSNEYVRQIIWLIFGLILFTISSLIKYDHYREFSLVIFIIGILLLIASLVFGKVVNGARSWLGIGELGIQPAEFMKLAYMIFAASFLERVQLTIQSLKTFVIAMALLMVPIGLIILQPDFGTAVVFFPIFLFMMFIGGAKKRHVFFFVFIGVITTIFLLVPAWDEYINQQSIGLVPVMKNPAIILLVLGTLLVLVTLSIFGVYRLKRPIFYWVMYGSTVLLISFLLAVTAFQVFKEYQILRLVVFLDPNIDPRGSGWHIIQSLTAVGSGGLMGKGFLQGTQSHYKFLPEQSTDFIFSIISEELGFIGALIIMGSYLVILGRILFVVRSSKDTFAASLAAGIGGMLFFHMVVNIGMTIGVLPITGIPLILVSYGGSSMLTAMLALGVVSSINANRYNF